MARNLPQQASRPRTQGARTQRLDHRVVLSARYCADDRCSTVPKKTELMKSCASRLLIGAIVGAVGAAALALDNLLPVAGVVAGAILGACFGLLTRSRAATPALACFGRLP